MELSQTADTLIIIAVAIIFVGTVLNLGILGLNIKLYTETVKMLLIDGRKEEKDGAEQG